MSMDRVYTVKEAAEAAGVSTQSIYTYTSRYKAYFSPHATPGKGQTRLFTQEDVRLLAYIRYKTTTGNMSHENLIAALEGDRGELEAFGDYAVPAEEPSTSLIDPNTLQAFQMLLQDTRQREQQAVSKLEDFQKENAELRQQLGVMQGKVELLGKPWWKKLLGL